MAEHDELRELRTDLLEHIREMRSDMRDRFDRMEGRIEHVMARLSDHESRISVMEDRAPAPPAKLMQNPRTYAVGGVGMAIGTIVLELMRTLGATWGAK